MPAARYTPFELGKAWRSGTYGRPCKWVGPLVSPASWGGLAHGGQLRQILVSGVLAISLPISGGELPPELRLAASCL